jgi:hypothetical protein
VLLVKASNRYNTSVLPSIVPAKLTAVAKQMREAEDHEQKLYLLEKLQAILKESQAVPAEMHEKQSQKKSSA